MKILKIALLTISFCAVFTVAASCAQEKILYEQAEYFKAEDKLSEYINTNGGDSNLLAKIYDSAINSKSDIKKALSSALYDCLLILLAVVICSAAGAFWGESEGKRMTNLAAAAAVSLICLGRYNSIIGLAASTISDFDGLLKSSMPAIASIMAAGGMPATAAMKQFGIVLFSQIFMFMTDKIVFPLINAYLAVSIAGAMSDAFDFKTLGANIKSFAVWIMKIVMFAYTGYIIIQGSMSYAADSFAVKSLKFTLTSTVPVLGSILGDAAGAVLQSAAVIKNTLGVIGIISAIDLAMLPVIKVGAIYALLKVTSAAISPFAGKEICTLVDNLSTVFNVLFILICSCAVVSIITFASAITAASPV